MHSGQKIEMERRRRALQRERYRRNFEEFARDQIKIRGAAPGEILTLDIAQKPAQRILHQRCEEQLKEHGWIRVRAIKARQQGFSTYSEGRAFHASALNRNTNSLLIANDKETTQTIFRIARFAYDNLSPHLRPMARYDSKSELVFENPDAKLRSVNPGLGSRMTFQQAKELAGTGTTIHFLHSSETSKWPEKACDMLETSLMPALHLVRGTVHIDESTAFTRGDYFHEKCDITRAGEDHYGWVLVPWWLEPTYAVPIGRNERFTRTEEERLLVALAKAGQKKDGVPPWELTKEQLKWRRIQIASRAGDGERLFQQEFLSDYESAWVTMDVNVFDLEALKRQAGNIRMPVFCAELKPSHINNYDSSCVKLLPASAQMVTASESYVAIWKLPEANHRYAMGVDVALGLKNGDWTVFQVFDQASREQVAEAHLHVDPDDAGWLAFSMGMFYNIAQINVELTGPGYNTDARLKKLYYPNIYFWRNRERIAPKPTNFTGWKTTPESKKFLIGMARPLFNHDAVTIHSRVLFDELRHFVVVPGFMQDQYYAESGDDDSVMAMLFSLVVCFDEDYVDETLMPGQVENFTEAERRAARERRLNAELAAGPWAVDNREFGSEGGDAALDSLVGSLKGWS